MKQWIGGGAQGEQIFKNVLSGCIALADYITIYYYRL